MSGEGYLSPTTGFLKVSGASARQIDGALNLSGVPGNATFAIAAGGSNVCEVTITVKDFAGDTLAQCCEYTVFLSDSATSGAHTGTATSGTVTNKSASGLVLATYVAKKSLRVQSLATGVFILEITDTAKTGFYVGVVLPTGRMVMSRQLVTADYG